MNFENMKNRAARRKLRRKSSRTERAAIEVIARLDRLETHMEAMAKPLQSKSDPNRFAGERFAEWFEHWWVMRLVFVAATIAALVAFVWFWDELRARGEEREARVDEQLAREEERLARAWVALTNTAPGNTGKVAALEYLAEHGEALVGLQLGGDSVATGAYLQGLELSDVEIRRSNFDYADIYLDDSSNFAVFDSSLNWAKVRGRLRDTIFGHVQANNAYFDVTVDKSTGFRLGVIFRNSNLDGATISFDASRAVIDDPALLYDGDDNQIYNVVNDNFAWSTRAFFEDVSLRCALIHYARSKPSSRHMFVNYFRSTYGFSSTNVSGAVFGPYKWAFSSSTDFTERGWDYGRVPQLEQWRDFVNSDIFNNQFINSYYYSDNPPHGLSNNILNNVLTKRDRNEDISMCEQMSVADLSVWRNDLAGNRQSAICQSLNIQPAICEFQKSEGGLSFFRDWVNSYPNQSWPPTLEFD